MFGSLFRKASIIIWAIKQIDDETLHLIGKGVLESDQKPRQMRAALLAGQYQGGVRIADTGMVLHSRLLAAVAPLEALQLSTSQNTARWQGQDWLVSWVPQRCWYYEGRLVAEPTPPGRSPALLSTEDISAIRQHVTPGNTPPGKVVFRPENELEDPEKDLRTSIEEAQRERKKAKQGWRKDGSRGNLDDQEDSNGH